MQAQEHGVDQADKPAPIHFVLDTSRAYKLVQSSILGTIKKHLPEGAYSQSASRSPNSLNFGLFIALEADVMMSHGVADKNYLFRRSPDRFLLNRFDHVLTPGAWLKRRVVASPDVKHTEAMVHTVGWPRLDLLLAQQAAYKPAPSKRPKVLWAPTHDFRRKGDDQVSTSSYPEFKEFLPRLKEHCDVSISLHPRNRNNKKPTSKMLIEADFVISDFGTMVYEAWALGKPVIFPHWIIGQRFLDYYPEGMSERHIFEKRIGLHPDSFDELIDTVRAPASVDPATKTFLDDYLDPAYLGRSGEHIAKLLLKWAPS